MKWNILLSLVIKWHIKQLNITNLGSVLKMKCNWPSKVILFTWISALYFIMYYGLFVCFFCPFCSKLFALNRMGWMTRDNKHRFQICEIFWKTKWTQVWGFQVSQVDESRAVVHALVVCLVKELGLQWQRLNQHETNTKLQSKGVTMNDIPLLG